MKKIIAIALTIVFCLCAVCMAEEADMLGQNELIDLMNALVDEAKAMPEGMMTVYEEEGEFKLDYESFALYCDQNALTATAELSGLEITPSEDMRMDMRGLKPGDTLEKLLAAYPLDNASLAGTRQEAVLYIAGTLPGTVNTGRLLRDGSHAQVVEHAIYAVDGQQVYASYIVYTLQEDVITAIQVMLPQQAMTLDEAAAELSALSALQAKDEYNAYRAEDPDEMANEDLYFMGFDFVTGTPAQLLDLLGAAQSDTWQQDGGNQLRIMQWDGAQAIFTYDSAKTLQHLNLLEIYEDVLEGPRGLRIGDAQERVVARFRHDAADGVLYGDGVNAPYGRCDQQSDGTVSVTYAVQCEDGVVLLRLTMVEGRMASMTATWR